jgi:hypothetical protein
MRLAWRDGLATLLVAAAPLLFVLWETGAALTGTSTRIVSAIVLVLGLGPAPATRRRWPGCMGRLVSGARRWGTWWSRRYWERSR